MSDYTPDEEQVREQYTREQPPQIGTVAEKRAEFDRFVARIKAEAVVEALHEAASAMEGEDAREWPFSGMDEMQRWLSERADPRGRCLSPGVRCSSQAQRINVMLDAPLTEDGGRAWRIEDDEVTTIRGLLTRCGLHIVEEWRHDDGIAFFVEAEQS